MFFKQKVNAIHVPHNKNTANCASVQLPPPAEVAVPMSMHSGSPAVPVVAVGDHVFVGQLIGREDGKISAPVHATVSGTVKAIEDRPRTGGGKCLSIVIESDGKMEKDPDLKAPVATNLQEFLDAIKLSGIVGLGGAAFPVWKKFEAVVSDVPEVLLINGAECEPYATSDTRTMIEDGEYVKKGIELVKEYCKIPKYVIGVESNKPEAIANLQEIFKDDPSVEVKTLKSAYPQGAKQVLLFNATGKVVKEGARLSSVGALIINVTSLAKVAHFFEDGMPLVSRVVTVDGSAINKPGNYVIPIGTSLKDVAEMAGGFKCDPGKIIVGGPMMGPAAACLEEPVIKATNCIVVMDEKDATVKAESACINCGRCVEACPLSLTPTAFQHALEIEDEDVRYATLKKEYIKTCMECGCCAFVCPAHRQIVDMNRKAKKFVRGYENALKEKEAAAKEGGKA